MRFAFSVILGGCSVAFSASIASERALAALAQCIIFTSIPRRYSRSSPTSGGAVGRARAIRASSSTAAFSLRRCSSLARSSACGSWVFWE